MDNIWEYIIRVDSDLSGAIKDLLELESINARLQNQNLENARKSREESAARKQLAEDARQAAQAQIAAELGVSKAMDAQKGIIEELRSRIKLLKQGREQADDVASINKYNSALQISQKQLNELTGATDKFKGSNGFWRDMQGWVLGALAVDRVADWTGKIFTAQSAVEGFKLSLNRLVGEQQAAQIEQQLKALIVDTPLQFEGAVKGVEKLIFAYQNAGQSTKTLVKDFQAYGNVAKGNEENLKGVIKALEDVGNQGKLTGQEILQFGNAGVNIIGLLAESTGKTRKEIKAMQADGTLSFDLVREALIKAGSEGGKFSGAMSVAMTTVSGRVSNFKDAVFFAMANVGDYFKESAKGIVTWGTSLIQTFFGTESQTKRTIDVLKTAGITVLTYLAATKAITTATTLWNAAKKALLVYQGLEILALEAQTGVTIAYTAAQLAARNAAIAFSGTLAATPWGAIALAVAGAVIALQQYSQTTDEANEFTLQAIKNTDEEIKGLITKKERINAASLAIFNLKEGSDAYKLAVGNLIKQAPEYFGKLDSETARYEDIRIAVRLANNEIERKIRLMAAEKLAEKVAGKVADVKLQIAEEEVANAQRLAKQQEYQKKQLELQKKGLQDGFDEQLGAEKMSEASLKQHTDKLKKLKEDESKYDLLLQKVSIDQATAQQKVYTERFQELVTLRKGGAIKTQKEFNEEVKKLNDEFFGNQEKHEKGITNLGKGEGDKRKKEKIDSTETLALIQEKTRIAELEKSEVQEQKLLAIDKDIAIQRINDSKASTAKKTAEILKIEQKFRIDLSNLTEKYDDIDEKERIKNKKESDKEYEKEAKNNAELLFKTIEDRINDTLKANEKLSEDLQKIDKDNAKESIKLEKDKYELIDKLRILQAISRAKNSKEIIELENKEKDSILNLNRDSIEKQLLAEKSKLYKMFLLKKENTVDYKTQQGIILKLEQDLVDAQIKLAEFTTDKTKDEIEKRQNLNKKALDFIIGSSITFLNVLDSILGDSLNNTTNLVEKAQIQNKQAIVNITKQGISAISSIVEAAKNGDYFAVATSAVGFLADGIMTLVTANKRLNEAKLEQARRQFEEYAQSVETGVAKIISRIEDIKTAYGDIKLESGATIGGTLSETLGLDLALNKLFRTQEILRDIAEKGIKSVNLQELADILRISLEDLDIILSSSNGADAIIESLKDVNNEINALGFNYSDVINQLINYGQQIQKEYEEGVDNENKLFEKKKDSIENTYKQSLDNIDKLYNAETAKIDKRYDYEALKANQKYNAETLGIVAAGTAQLEALITNENVLSEVRAEFAAKRLQIEQAFPLASKEITSDMSQAEIDAINASIKARDDAFAQLQERYNSELIAIAESEGQKRKEYTATEKIQNKIRDRLVLAAITFNADEIERERLKGLELEKQEKNRKDKSDAAEVIRDLAKLTAKEENDAALLALEKKKNDAIAGNYKLLVLLLESYSEQIASAIEKSTDRSSEAYRGLINDLSTINELLRQIRNNSGSEPLNIGINGIAGFKNGTERLPNMSGRNGVDTELIRADVGERIMQTGINNQLKSFFGRDLTNNELAFRAMNTTMPMMNYEMLANMNNNTNFTDKELLSEMKSINKGLKNLKQVNVDVKNGYTTVTERSSNRMIIHA